MGAPLLALPSELCRREPKVRMKKTEPVAGPNRSFKPGAGEGDDRAANAVTISDDSSSFSRRSSRREDSQKDWGGYITFEISSYSKEQRSELKNRLVSELDQVRSLGSRMDLQTSARSSSAAAHPNRIQIAGSNPPPELLKSFPAATSAGIRELERSPELLVGVMSRCGQILAKLMKHKGGAWFNAPVDTIAMGLHDYHRVINRPMDLGTVKSKLDRVLYQSPIEFADDIRLTFNNALLYNPQGHEVYAFASQLLRLFEAEFGPALDKYLRQQLRPQPAARTPVSIPEPQQLKIQPSAGKLPKPTGKDSKKRAMSYEEKRRLSEGIESLDMLKRGKILQILRRRRKDLMDPWLSGSMVELDFGALDDETLWELDLFVGSSKKTTTSKIKNQESSMGFANSISVPLRNHDTPMMSGESADRTAGKRIKIGDSRDELQWANYSPLEIKREDGSSSSSGADSSSSSTGSDTESSPDDN